MSTSWDIVAELEAVRATEPDAGPRNTLRPLYRHVFCGNWALGGGTPILKALILDRAARIMGSLDREPRHAFQIDNPRLAQRK